MLHGDEDNAKMEEMAKDLSGNSSPRKASPISPERRRHKLALALQTGEEMQGHAERANVSQRRWRTHKDTLVADQRKRQAEVDYLEGRSAPPGSGPGRPVPVQVSGTD